MKTELVERHRVCCAVMQASNKQIHANFSALRQTLRCAPPSGYDNTCQPMISWLFQWFVPYPLSQETLSQVKTNPSPDCYFTHGGVYPLGLRWDILQTLPLTLLFCCFQFILQWSQLMLKNDICFVLLTLELLPDFLSALGWGDCQPKPLFLPHQRVYTWGLRDI